MTEKSGATLSRFGRYLLAVCAVVVSASGLLAQASTGKVEGSVADPNGQPVTGAQIAVLGTAYSATTDQHGYWFINNVPAGTYELQAQYIGFQPSRVTNVRVLGGQTITVDFTLSTAVELGVINVTAASNPIVPRDQVTSRTIVTGSLVDNLPIDNVRQMLDLQPGVVESGRGTDPSIRGGRPGEAAVYVDGALVRSVQNSGAQANVGTNALEEASVTTGAIGAEFGDAQSGVLSFVTRSGGQRWSGSVSYQTDEGVNGDRGLGFNRLEAGFGGPLMGNLTFYVSTVLDGQQSAERGTGFEDAGSYVLGGLDTTVTEVTATGTRDVDIPRFIQFGGACDPAQNYGFECQGGRAPYNWSTEWSRQAKLQYSYGSGSNISLSYVSSRDQSRSWNGGFAPQRTRGTRNTSDYYILNLFQEVNRSADNALSVTANLSYQTDNSIVGPLAREYEVNNRAPFGGFAFSPMEHLFDFDHFTDEPGADVTALNTDAAWDQLLQNIRTNTGTRVPYLDRNDLRNAQEFRMNPFAVENGYPNAGLDVGISLYEERRLQGRFNLDWQANRYNRIKLGADGRQARVNFFSSGILRQSFQDIYTEEPKSYGAFLQDRLDLGDVVVELGMRWDYFDTGALIPSVPGRIFTDPAFDPANPTANLVRVQSHTAWSPTIRVSFPVTENTGFRLSYAQQVQSPDMFTILQGLNNDLSFTNTNDVFARDVTFGKSILFEFGLRHAFTQDFVVDVAAYNKDKVSDYSARVLPFQDPVTNREVNINVLTNADFGNVRGVDMQVTRRVGDIFNGTLAYTFQVAKNTGSDPLSYLRTSARQVSAVTGDRVDPPQAILPTDDNRTHNIVGALAFTFPSDFGADTWYGKLLHNGGAFIRYRLQSGLPYTRLVNAGNGQTAPFLSFGLSAQRDEPINSSTMPWTKAIDVRLTRGFAMGGLDLTAFADIRNLFNFRNITSLFAETGDVVNALNRDNAISPEISRLEQDAGKFLVKIDDGTGTLINAINLPGDCDQWSDGPTNCVLLTRAEARFGDGNGVYDENEYTAAFIANYNLFGPANGGGGTYALYGPARSVRLGLELRF